ncbi:hypothetical protein C8R43DRAFT_1244094 [Mycena crocata]|nr:hypothetical protein C8R43DRAFT_1244094 [Mycena crocata]
MAPLDDIVPGSKKRRLKNSCDRCKQRKIKCDSAEMPGNRCSHCINFGVECTHGKSFPELQKLRLPMSPPQNSTPDDFYPHNAAQAHVAAIVLHATEHIAEVDVRQVLIDVARYARSLELKLNPSTSFCISVSAASSSPDLRNKKDDDDEFVNDILTERFDPFRKDSDVDRYFGRTSHFELIHTAMGIKESFVKDTSVPKRIPVPTKRRQFWFSPWEHQYLTPEEIFPPLIFPEPDLLETLVSIFFSQVNIVICLLHRPTFEKSLASGDYNFGSTVLGVCEIAAKYSDDPRCVLEGTDTALSSGWKYFCQLQPLRQHLIRTFTLYEAQMLCLCVLYLHGSSAADGCWIIGGAGIRCVQEIGVHRRNRYADKVVEEQWKPVFWILVCIDTIGSSLCGRPQATSSDDPFYRYPVSRISGDVKSFCVISSDLVLNGSYDLDYPIECSDKFWEPSDPALAFIQPPGTPSTISYMVAYLKLIQIMSKAQQTIYRVQQKNTTEQSKQDSVASLDSALNAWVDSIPSHLKWDPHRADPIFGAQSADLYAGYYHVRIHIHRLFLGFSVRKPPPEISKHYPSLAICTNSARACCHVLDVALRRGFLCNPHILNAVFDASIILLLNLWGGRRLGLNVDPQKSLRDVDTCLHILSIYETRWQIAGRQHDIITQLMSAANMDLQYAPNPLKRRDPEPPLPDRTSEETNEVPSSPLFFSGQIPGLELDSILELPMHTDDLGRLPGYEPLYTWDKDKDGNDRLPDALDSSTEPVLFSNSTAGFGTLSPDSFAVLTDTPAGYDWDGWGSYISGMEELMNVSERPPWALP